ncbi:hypothetical protein [Streptomyces sp. LN785]|uniref:hypothetical protein n=1 Tax=Streptomyces sp. LN785 TaxID=3112983 RepID=UPI0037194273
MKSLDFTDSVNTSSNRQLVLSLNPSYKPHPNNVHVGDHITAPAKPAPKPMKKPTPTKPAPKPTKKPPHCN